ncbi:aconitate hydratase [Clostridium magnum]|uniref:Homoaconitase large subunit n=1 Tax=Clostridium magnum DSM 2767 TaxID=1121326 RepID=A0A161WY28_9CLOT|nr:aconitate hydratase [Clostridium magnum]KZL91978.1 homoaconitase large subunit [Clostridium magnum DSM 2767]SHH27518.1 aconitase [Clostridium magnum DSM 2767]
MGKNLTRKIFESHLVEGRMVAGEEIRIKIDQTLTQDAAGIMAYVAFEALELPRVRTEVSVSYVDHNTLQVGFENADDHIFLKTSAEKFGVYYSKPGNGICHKVHTQRFAVPGKTLLGSDSHTTTSGALGMIAIGAGGMSVAMAMAGEPFPLVMPKVVNVKLTGKLRTGVSAKDVVLELLRRMTIKGGVGKVIEYTGPGVETLSVTERQTISSMGAELGAITAIFPSDKISYEFLKAQGREEDWIELSADEDAEYDEVVEVKLGELEPMVAKPRMPDKVVKIRELEDTKIDQVFIGSCTNSSYGDLAKAAAILDGKCVHPDVSLSVAAGSKQVFEMIARDGILQKLISAGARVLESACGPCVGIGQSPPTGGISLRTSNRNFIGISGTVNAQVYLSSPEVAAASAITGLITDPREIADLEVLESIKESTDYIIDDRMIIAPRENTEDVVIKRGPNIRTLPVREGLDEEINIEVLIKIGDNITTDEIMPLGAKILSLSSNIPAISQYIFNVLDPTFSERSKENNGGIIIAGENYGYGSSREHAALALMYLGVKSILAKSFARIHHDNLINHGILPLVFKEKADYKKICPDDTLVIKRVKEQINSGEFIVVNETKGFEFKVVAILSDRQKEVILSGGQLNYIKRLL